MKKPKSVNLSGNRIKERRNILGLTQVDVAASLEVDLGIRLDRSDISEIERGVRAIKDTELAAFAKVLGISPLWLMYGDNSPKFQQK